PAPERFPLLPDPHERPFDTGALTSDSVLEDHHDAFAVGRAWYSYAQEAIPEPDRLPGHTKPITDRVRQRLPKFTTLLFRHYPARSQTYVGERLEREGWFDDDGWTVTGWFKSPGGGDRPLKVGGGRKWAEDAWRQAHEMWREHGERNGLLLGTREQELAMRQQAEKWVQKGGQRLGEAPREMTEQEKADPELVDAHFAFAFLHWNSYYRSLSNFAHFYHRSEVEMRPEAVAARKRFFAADHFLGQARRTQALAEYEKPDALRRWKELMRQHPDFRNDNFIQEEAFEIQHKYLELYRDLYGRQLKQRLALLALLGQAAGAPPAAPEWLPLSSLARPQLAPDLELRGPLDDVISEQAAHTVKLRLGIIKPQGPPPGMMPPGMAPPGGGPPTPLPPPQTPPGGSPQPSGK
ncbi:MAG TPA: hypothetical protein VFA26_09980, partial [Gemmataceae bacterium]|nr:hypothetical protein [Gemmataceae bacterium]